MEKHEKKEKIRTQKLTFIISFRVEKLFVE